jgi:hypothetical protein
MKNTITGSCLCGKVRYEVQGPLNIFQYCHCSRCRKFTGSAHSAHIFVPPSQFSWISGEEQVGRFEHPEAKYFATAFCKNCGSSLPWAVKGGKNIVVTAGTLDDDPGLKPRCNVFWGSRAEWFDDTGNLEKFDEIPSRK